MSDLREQVTQLAAEGHILDVAAAVVGAEQERLIALGEHRARWEPSASVYTEPIGFPDIEFIDRPRMERRRPVVAALGAVVFRVGDGEYNDSFRVEPSFEGELAEDEFILDILARFSRAYCSAEYTRGRPATTIIPRQAVAEAETKPPTPTRFVDSRRLDPASRYISAPLTGSQN